ncbi:MAG: ATP phosphoribosyltransferase [Firmicutes bacterium]|nr:ATP phosphoribosyltransferase [Bacillota bacterium]
MLKLALPSGSLQKGTIEMFEAADLSISTPDARCYEATIDDPRISRVRWMRPQEIPLYVAEGLFDLGIGGYDWVLERGCENDVEIIMNLNYSKQSHRPVRLVVAVSENSDIQKPTDIKPGSKVTTEYVSIAAKYFEKLGIPVKIDFSFGTTEAKVPEIADVAVELTESGSSLRANNLKIIDTVMESSTVLMANKKSWQDPEKRGHINDIVTLLRGVLEARDKVLMKMNVSQEALDAVLAILPSMKRPTISQLSGGNGNQLYYAVESVVEKDGINTLIPNLKAAGAEDIIEIPISKVIR